MNFGKLLNVLRLYRAGAPLGDVVVLKLDALSRPTPAVAERLRELHTDGPPPALPALRRMRDGTLGREYARFLDANGIVPLEVSAALRKRAEEDPYALRYTETHDLHHVLTGFDTGLAGEMGVLAFNVGQGSAPISRWMLRFASLLYAALSPTQAARILHNVRVGLEMGERAALVMAAPLERALEKPLAEARRDLGLEDPRRAGVQPSGDSLIVRLFYSRKMASA
jgi:ubiquinone biosynthesis protein Coq4